MFSKTKKKAEPAKKAASKPKASGASKLKKEYEDLLKLINSLESVKEKKKHYAKLEELKEKLGLQ